MEALVKVPIDMHSLRKMPMKIHKNDTYLKHLVITEVKIMRVSLLPLLQSRVVYAFRLFPK